MGARDQERHRDMDDGESVRIPGIDIPLRDIVVVSLKVAIVWAILGIAAWIIVAVIA